MTPSQFLVLAVVLVVTGVVLIVSELKVARLRSMAGGLGVNVVAAGVVFGVQAAYANKWNLVPFMIGGGISLIITLTFALYRQMAYLRERQKSAHDIDELKAKLSELQSKAPAPAIAPPPGDIRDSGMTFYARNYQQYFKPVTGQDFGEYVRSFVLSSDAGSEFKIIGIDWTELFGAAISGTSERYFPILKDQRTTFRIMILDPRSRAGLEKRTSEFDLRPSGTPRYQANHPQRIYGKVLGAVEMIAGYHKTHPRQVRFKFTQEIPMACAILNGKEAIFHFYSRCHKGWDSPVFRSTRLTNGIYEFLDEYFEFMWEHPAPSISDEAWRAEQSNLTPLIAQLEQVLNSACQGPEHAGCTKVI